MSEERLRGPATQLRPGTCDSRLRIIQKWHLVYAEAARRYSHHMAPFTLTVAPAGASDRTAHCAVTKCQSKVTVPVSVLNRSKLKQRTCAAVPAPLSPRRQTYCPPPFSLCIGAYSASDSRPPPTSAYIIVTTFPVSVLTSQRTEAGRGQMGEGRTALPFVCGCCCTPIRPSRHELISTYEGGK
jgi:hypothetical protein